MKLEERIREQRDRLSAFISKQRPRNKWLINLAIICGVIGTAFAGIPASAGKPAIDALGTSWQFMCIGASIFTLTATVATSLRSNHNLESKLSKAQVCATRLEILELQLSGGHMEERQAIEKYQEYISEVAFLN